MLTAATRVELITDTNDILLSDSVNEGVWDCLVYAQLWDKYFCTIRNFILQRKEIPLLASDYEPYAYLTYDARYDGVLRTRTGKRERTTAGSCYELCLFETSSRFEGESSRKWVKDRTKLIAGCRAMLYRLQEMVNYNTTMMQKLQVVGVLQAGESSFSGVHIYHRSLPHTTRRPMVPDLYHVLP